MLMWVSAGQPYAVMQNGAMYQALRGLRAVFFLFVFSHASIGNYAKLVQSPWYFNLSLPWVP